MLRRVIGPRRCVELTPNVADITLIAKAAADGGADAVSAVKHVRVDGGRLASAEATLGNTIGGLSGPAIKPLGAGEAVGARADEESWRAPVIVRQVS